MSSYFISCCVRNGAPGSSDICPFNPASRIGPLRNRTVSSHPQNGRLSETQYSSSAYSYDSIISNYKNVFIARHINKSRRLMFILTRRRFNINVEKWAQYRCEIIMRTKGSHYRGKKGQKGQIISMIIKKKNTEYMHCHTFYPFKVAFKVFLWNVRETSCVIEVIKNWPLTSISNFFVSLVKFIRKQQRKSTAWHYKKTAKKLCSEDFPMLKSKPERLQSTDTGDSFQKCWIHIRSHQMFIFTISAITGVSFHTFMSKVCEVSFHVC